MRQLLGEFPLVFACPQDHTLPLNSPTSFRSASSRSYITFASSLRPISHRQEDHPEAASQKDALARRQAIFGAFGVIPHHQSIPCQLLFNGLNRSNDPRVVHRQKPHHFNAQARRVPCSAVLSSAAKQAGDSKVGQQSQSIDPPAAKPALPSRSRRSGHIPQSGRHAMGLPAPSYLSLGPAIIPPLPCRPAADRQPCAA